MFCLVTNSMRVHFKIQMKRRRKKNLSRFWTDGACEENRDNVVIGMMELM